MSDVRTGIQPAVREELEKLGTAAGVKSIALTTNAEGKVTGGTWIGTDGKSNVITVTGV